MVELRHKSTTHRNTSLADSYGNGIHPLKMLCSTSTSKVIEEAPSPVLSSETRSAMGEVALQCFSNEYVQQEPLSS